MFWIGYSAEILALISALLFFKYLKKFSLGVMLPLLLFVVVNENFANNGGYFLNKPTLFFYNLYRIISPVFYFILFYRMLKIESSGRIIFLISCIILLIIGLYNYFDPADRFDVRNTGMFYASYIVLCLLMFTKLFRREVNIELLSHPYFWITSGIFLFTIVAIVMEGLQPFFIENKDWVMENTFLIWITPTINIVLYMSFSFAFYLCKRHSKRQTALHKH